MLDAEQIDNWDRENFDKCNQELVEDFHDAMGQPKDQTWSMGTDLESMRLRLIQEEFTEFTEEDNPEAILKELADILYVCYGYAVTYGWNLEEAFYRVCKSNMSKLGEDGKPIYREDGKVLKGKNYKPPELGDLV